MPAGRPLKFKDIEGLQKEINKYFDDCDNRQRKEVTKNGDVIYVPAPRPYTVTGLALALETNRETLINYENRDEFFDTIKNAKLKCENFAEESLWTEKIAAGVIFNLKNNYGWKDKVEVENYGKNGKDLFPVNDEEAEHYAQWKLQQGTTLADQPTSTAEAPIYLDGGQPDEDEQGDSV